MVCASLTVNRFILAAYKTLPGCAITYCALNSNHERLKKILDVLVQWQALHVRQTRRVGFCS